MRFDKNRLILVLVTVGSTLAVWFGVGPPVAYKNFDGPLYVAVAQTWYDREAIRERFSFPLPLEYYPAHLPGFPALIWVTTVVASNPFWGMLFITLLGAITGSIVFYEIAKDHKWPNPLLLAMVWLFFWPRMWAVRSVGSPETWFITFIMAGLWMFEKKRFLWSGIWGGLAIWTKSPGALLIPVLLINNFYNRNKSYKHYIPVVVMTLAGLGLFGFYQWRTGDFWAYFNTGDNIHLGLPFHIFDSRQIWVGDAWLEEVLWIYFVGTIGIIRAWKLNKLWSIWGGLFLAVITLVGHRDIARYSLPIVPTVLLGFSDLFRHKSTKIILMIMLIPLFFYTANFLRFNVMEIADWGEFLGR